jgi:flagellar export protein FliJ
MYELAERIRTANQIENEIAHNEERSRQVAEEAREKGREGMPGAIYALYSSYRDDLGLRSRDARRRLVRAEALVEKQRQALVKASVDRKIMETFKERQRQTYLRETARKEQEEMEEMAAMVQSRKPHEEE